MNMYSYKCCDKQTPESGNIIDQLDLLKLIAEENRLRLLCILINGEHCVTELLGHVKLSQSLVSHHLADLRKAFNVTSEKRGREVFYRLSPRGANLLIILRELSDREEALS